jgi:hypothetical protein
MTSLVTLAYAARPTTPPFNHDFYVTAATVIPVLFLAINVQPIFQLVSSFAARRIKRKLPGADNMIVITVVAMAVYACLALGVVGELVAIAALGKQTAPKGNQSLLTTTIVLLTFAAAAGPFLSLLPGMAEQSPPPMNTPATEPPGPGTPYQDPGSTNQE